MYALDSLDARGTNRPKRTLSGHTSFVYSLATVANANELISSGEDRSVRVWQGDALKQTLTIPAISIWSVGSLPDGDIVCGSSDHQVRVFSRQKERRADQEELDVSPILDIVRAGQLADAHLLSLLPTVQVYERSIASQALNKTQVGDVRKDDVPGVEALSQPGNKEGQTKMVSNNGVIEAHQWSMASQKWEKIGEVVGGVGSGQKKLHQGKEYDYVFDVDIADGVPPLKLPYNLSENAYSAAQKFLDKNELPAEYLEQVVSFIDKNVEGATIGGRSNEAYVDPFSGTAGRYVPGSGGASTGTNGSRPAATASAPPAMKILPQRSYLSFKQANLPALQAKLSELSASSGSPIDAAGIIAALGSSSSPVDLTPLSQAMTSWPPAARLPLLDIYRLSALQGTSAPVQDFVSTIFQGAEWSSPVDSKAKETNTMLAARGTANLFSSPQVGQLLKLAEEVLAQLHSADFAKMNKNGRVAFATIVYNFSVAITASAEVQSFAGAVLDAVVKILTEEEGDSEVIYRTLIALGNLLVSASSKTLQVGSVQLARDAAEAWGSRLSGSEERMRVIAGDLKSLDV